MTAAGEGPALKKDTLIMKKVTLIIRTAAVVLIMALLPFTALSCVVSNGPSADIDPSPSGKPEDENGSDAVNVENSVFAVADHNPERVTVNTVFYGGADSEELKLSEDGTFVLTMFETASKAAGIDLKGGTITYSLSYYGDCTVDRRNYATLTVNRVRMKLTADSEETKEYYLNALLHHDIYLGTLAFADGFDPDGQTVDDDEVRSYCGKKQVYKLDNENHVAYLIRTEYDQRNFNVYAYGESGRLEKMEYELPDRHPDSGVAGETTYEYDADGKLESFVDRKRTSADAPHDSVNEAVTVYRRDGVALVPVSRLGMELSYEKYERFTNEGKFSCWEFFYDEPLVETRLYFDEDGVLFFSETTAKGS